MPPTNPSCAGCVYQAPSKSGQPLIVFLHGDGVKTTDQLIFQLWPLTRVAKARGYGLFAPICPRDQGCDKASYWQWQSGDPSIWLQNQLARIGADHPFDSARVWAVGWSGGATYLGYYAFECASIFDAVAYVGGGAPPGRAICPKCSYPAYFISGDKNPYHQLAKSLREYHQNCGPEPVWNLLTGADHAKEFADFSAPGHAEAIVDWFEHVPAPSCATTTAPSTSASASTDPSATTIDATPKSPQTSSISRASSAPSSHQSLPCGCDSSLALGVFLVFVIARRWARHGLATRLARNLLQNAG
jgi:poly(3-hydroxybutyrate) depolymerase